MQSSQTRQTLICIDSYGDGIPTGWLCHPLWGQQSFSSMSQLLLRMEALLDECRCPQSYTTPRRFCQVPEPSFPRRCSQLRWRGNLATFDLTVIFRQNSSWQGLLHWRETGREERFRSVLELVVLLDSALRMPQEAENNSKNISQLFQM